METKAVDMLNYYLSLGTNLGNKQVNLAKACDFLKLNIGKLVAVAGLYTSEPWGYTTPNVFLNTCVQLASTKQPLEVLDLLKQYEKTKGRTKSTESVYQDRLIDLDIVLVGDLVLESNNLTLPHKEMHNRKFVLKPLAEIAPFIIHPVLSKTIDTLAKECTDKNDVELILTDWYETENRI